MNGAMLGMSKGEVNRKFDRIVEFAGVEKFLDTPVKHYSSGMYVRLAFAVATHLESDILLVDEVLAVGDATFQGKCLREMEDKINKGKTVLLVSHSIDHIKALCKQAIVLEKGRVEFIGNTESAIRHYNAIVGENISEQL